MDVSWKHKACPRDHKSHPVTTRQVFWIAAYVPSSQDIALRSQDMAWDLKKSLVIPNVSCVTRPVERTGMPNTTNNGPVHTHWSAVLVCCAKKIWGLLGALFGPSWGVLGPS